jgi:hypothetical protein
MGAAVFRPDVNGSPPMVSRLTAHSLWWKCAILVVACCGTAAQAQQFSADLVSTGNRAAASVGKIRALDDKVRIETPDFPDGFFLSEASHYFSYFARPNARIYMDARQSSWLVAMLVPVDPDDPCPRWRGMVVASGAEDRNGQWRCERAGEEILAGRKLVRYRIISSSGRQTIGWIDPDLKFPLKIQKEDGTAAVVGNIQQGPQPEPLFEIPAGFRKFDPAELIKRIKQSDVWVEEPAR